MNVIFDYFSCKTLEQKIKLDKKKELNKWLNFIILLFVLGFSFYGKINRVTVVKLKVFQLLKKKKKLNNF